MIAYLDTHAALRLSDGRGKIGRDAAQLIRRADLLCSPIVFIELEYLFNLSDLGIVPNFTPDQQQLSDVMISYWTQFAKTGTPNFEGAPHWPRFRGAGSQFESLIAPTPTTESDASFDSFHKCSSFWNLL